MCETLSFAGLILSCALLLLVCGWFAYLFNDCWVFAQRRQTKERYCVLQGEVVRFLITLCYFSFGVNSILTSRKGLSLLEISLCQRSKFLPVLYPMHGKVQYSENSFSGQVTTAHIVHMRELRLSQKSSVQVLKLWPSSTHVLPRGAPYKFKLCPHSNGSWSLVEVFSLISALCRSSWRTWVIKKWPRLPMVNGCQSWKMPREVLCVRCQLS